MSFISVAFIIFIFAVCLVYYLVPLKVRWCVLLAASYLFFWLNSEWLLLIMLAATLITWGTGRLVDRNVQKMNRYLESEGAGFSKAEKKAYQKKEKARRRALTVIGVILVLGILLFLKYFNFFASVSNVLLKHVGLKIRKLSLLLPIGISFYTLQAIAYMTDVYRGKASAERNLLHFMLFMSYFPQILQGPIPRYNQLAGQLVEGHRFDYDRFCKGIQLIIWGFFKKMVIADRIAIPVSEVFGNYPAYHGLLVFLAAAGYGVQVYADFSGGMDIARGFSQMVGIDLELNFLQPYFSTSVEDFWRRWHITLGGFMRDYVFYPLSLSKAFNSLTKRSRKIFGDFFGKKVGPFLAMFIVYFLVGFWHGPASKYIAYGLWNGIFISGSILLADVYEKGRKTLRVREKSVCWRLFQMLRTFVIISFGRFFSNAIGTHAALSMMKSVFDRTRDLSFLINGSLIDLGLDNANWMVLIVSIVLLLLVDLLHERGIEIREGISRQNLVFRWIIYTCAVAVIILFGVYGPNFNAASFIYEQF